MSNEYKDWELDEIAWERSVVEKYPFLKRRNIDGSLDTTSRFPMMCLEIPEGWYRLFFQMCDDIKPHLESAGLLDDFYFIQVKEKFNHLRCYTCTKVPIQVKEILAKYEYLSRFVCTICGAPATHETIDYIASVCECCLHNVLKDKAADVISFEPYLVINSKIEGVHFDEKKISLKKEWKRYLAGLA